MSKGRDGVTRSSVQTQANRQLAEPGFVPVRRPPDAESKIPSLTVGPAQRPNRLQCAVIRYSQLLIFLLVAAAVTSVSAQDRSDCDERRADADETIARSNDRPFDRSNLDAGARSQILKMYEVCNDESFKGQYGPLLIEIEERRAEQLFEIAKYYFNLYRTGKGGGIKGAEARLREIIEKFVHYSKSDEVLLLLGRTYILEHQQDNATTTFGDLIRKYPASPLAYRAQVYLDRLAAQPTQ